MTKVVTINELTTAKIHLPHSDQGDMQRHPCKHILFHKDKLTYLYEKMPFCMELHNKGDFLASGDFCHLLIANNLDPDHAPT